MPVPAFSADLRFPLGVAVTANSGVPAVFSIPFLFPCTPTSALNGLRCFSLPVLYVVLLVISISPRIPTAINFSIFPTLLQSGVPSPLLGVIFRLLPSLSVQRALVQNLPVTVQPVHHFFA